MKFLAITLLALVGFAAAAQLPDSATQGPNPQDIATPEPEYIDIDLPEPPRPAAPAQPRPSVVTQPRPVQRPVAFAPVAQVAQPAPVQRTYLPPQQQFVQHQQPQVPGHTFNSQTGYQYRRPVYVRRTYRRRY